MMDINLLRSYYNNKPSVLGGGNPTFPASIGSALKLYIDVSNTDHPEYDNSGNGHTVTNTGPATVTSVANGNILTFDGSTTYLTVNHATDLAITNNFCIAFVFKPANLTQSNKYVMDKMDYAILWEYVNNTLELFGPGATGDTVRTGTQIPVADTNPHIIIYNYNGSVLQGYKDNSLIINPNKVFSLATTAYNMWIGSAYVGADKNACNMGDIIIMNRAATASEITGINQYLAWKHGITIS